MKTYRLEMRSEHVQRTVEADSWAQADGWMIFYRLPPQGGAKREHWRVQMADVVCMETKP